MVTVLIQNFAIDGSDPSSLIGGVNGLEDIQDFLPPTPTFLQVTFVDGRTIQLTGAFVPVVDAVATLNFDILLERIDELRIDTVSVFVGNQPYIDISDLDLHGEEVVGFIGSSDLAGGLAYVFSGNDTIVSGPGDDTLRGFAGDDIVLGFEGSDLIFGEEGDDELNGNRGADVVDGGPGRDFVRGGQEGDLIYGEFGDDWHVNGNNGDDVVFGEDGNDAIFGGRDDDQLFGGDGDDDVSGDLGNDTLDGGFGADWFFFRSGGGADLLMDFFPVEDGDLILVEFNVNGSGINSPAAAYASVFDTPNGAVLDLGGGHGVTIFGHTRQTLAESDFAIF